MKYTEHPVDDEGWTEWIRPAENWKERCCDCGLVHDVRIQVRSNKKARKDELVKVYMKFRRNEKATAASRRSGRYTGKGG